MTNTIGIKNKINVITSVKSITVQSDVFQITFSKNSKQRMSFFSNPIFSMPMIDELEAKGNVTVQQCRNRDNNSLIKILKNESFEYESFINTLVDLIEEKKTV